jgi:maltose phosphorylase
MAKTPIRYLEVDPWVIEEKDFHPARSQVSEAIFSVGNEFMGVRGYFEEGYSRDAVIGSFFNGIFEQVNINHPLPHRGLAVEDHFMVNAVDWLYTRIRIDGEQLDLATSKVSGFVRRLSLKDGVLSRSFVWHLRGGRRLAVKFERFTSMACSHLGGQRITLEAANFAGTVELETGLDVSIQQYDSGKRHWTAPQRSSTAAASALVGRTQRSGHMVCSVFALQSEVQWPSQKVLRDKYIGRTYRIALKRGQPVSVAKMVANFTEKRAAIAPRDFGRTAMTKAKKLLATDFAAALASHARYWQQVWDRLDIEIEGDPLNQQGVRFCIFQLHQTYHGVDPANNVAAKGLTGEGYGGKTWWDTETYCQPFYMFNNPQASRNLLEYRYRTLPQACARSREVDDCVGARYPMATIDGTETIAVWQHGDLEIHVPAAIPYALWHYQQVVGDRSFLHTKGIEMLIEVSRYFASRGQYSQRNGDFGFWNVMGADEFHMQVHNNVYTNLMAKKTFEYTLAVLAEMKTAAPTELARVTKKVGLRPGEPRDWRAKAKAMRTNFDPKTELFEQHDGFFDLPHIDCATLDPDDLPLYDHWAYLRIFRYDMIKQPDVLLPLFFFSHEYSDACKKVNYEYYEPRCSHESSLSPSIHSIMAAELGKHRQAYTYFQHATRLDLDDYNRNTKQGLHTTSMAAAWMNIVQGFGGMRTDADLLDFKPSIPRAWRAFSFKLLYRGSVLKVRIDKRQACFTVTEGPPVRIMVFGRKMTVGPDGVAVALPKSRIEA